MVQESGRAVEYDQQRRLNREDTAAAAAGRLAFGFSPAYPLSLPTDRLNPGPDL